MKPKLITTMQSYDRGLFMADLFAGFTVAMVAMPLSLAIAIASGADPAKGLVTAIVAAAETVPAGVAQIVELMDFGLRAYLGGHAG